MQKILNILIFATKTGFADYLKGTDKHIKLHIVYNFYFLKNWLFII